MGCDLAPRLVAAVLLISRLIRLPVGCGRFDQSREWCDGANRVHDHLSLATRVRFVGA